MCLSKRIKYFEKKSIHDQQRIENAIIVKLLNILSEIARNLIVREKS